MSQTSPEPSISRLSARVDEIVLGMKWVCSFLLVVLTVPNLCVSLSIYHFQEIFQDALPGKPLPLLTLAVIHYRVLHHLLVVALPAAGIVGINHQKRIRGWIMSTVIVASLIGLQLFLTWVALFLPMIGLFVGMSDSTAK